MTFDVGSMIGPYRLIVPFKGGANCNYAFAERSGKKFFIKEFHRPKFPPDCLRGPTRAAKLARWEVFVTRHMRLLDAMRRVCARDGNIVVPDDVFQFGLAYYHVAPQIDIMSLRA